MKIFFVENMYLIQYVIIGIALCYVFIFLPIMYIQYLKEEKRQEELLDCLFTYLVNKN